MASGKRKATSTRQQTTVGERAQGNGASHAPRAGSKRTNGGSDVLSATSAGLPRILSPQAALTHLAQTANGLRPAQAKLYLRAAASALVDRINFARHAGFDTYAGVRNLFAALGYKTELTISDYRDMYRRGGISKTIVDCLPDEMWSGGVSVTESDDPEQETQFDRDVKSLFKRLDVVSRLKKADKLAGLASYSVILIGVADKPNADLSSEMPRLKGPDSIIYLQQYAQDCAPIIELETDVSSPRLGLPKYYQITVGNPANVNPTGVMTSSKVIPRVHWSRIVHVSHDCLESDYIGTPDLEAVWNYLTDLLKVVGGGAEAAWRKMDQGLHINLLPEYDHTTEGMEEIEEQLEMYRHNLERDITTEGVDIKPLTSQVDKYGTNVDPIIDLIAGTRRIPRTTLIGNEIGLRSSEQNTKALSNAVKARETEFGEPLVRQLVDRLLKYGGLAKLTSAEGEYVCNWYEEEELDEDEKADTTEKMARANQAQKRAGDTVILTSDEIRDRVWSLGPLEEDTEADDEGDAGDREQTTASDEEEQEEETEASGEGSVQVNADREDEGGIPSAEERVAA